MCSNSSLKTASQYNRFTADDAGFSNDLDSDSTAAGFQFLAANPGSEVSISSGGGNDLMLLGVDERAGLLRAKSANFNSDGHLGMLGTNRGTNDLTMPYQIRTTD